MSGTAILSEMISLLVGAITGIAEGVGSGLSTLAQSIFLQGSGDAQTLSVFGIFCLIFMGISLSIGLCRWVVSWLTSMGN